MQHASDLNVLVETEARLDETIAAAQRAADAMRDAARVRARVAEAELAEQLVREEAAIVAAIAGETAERERTITVEATTAIARYDSVDIRALARRFAHRVAEIAEEDAS